MRTLRTIPYLAFVLLVSSSQSFAEDINDDPEIIGTIEDRGFTLFDNGDRVFGCSQYDRNNDGVDETTTVWVRLGKALSENEAPGILQNPYIENSFEEFDSTTCEDLAKIKASSVHSFGAIYGTFDSVVTLEKDELHETLTVTLRESQFGPAADDDIATVSLSAEVTKKLGNEG